MMRMTEELFEHCAMNLHGTTKIPMRNPANDEIVEIDVKAPWIRMSMKDCLRNYAKIDPDTLDDDQNSKAPIR